MGDVLHRWIGFTHFAFRERCRGRNGPATRSEWSVSSKRDEGMGETEGISPAPLLRSIAGVCYDSRSRLGCDLLLTGRNLLRCYLRCGFGLERDGLCLSSYL